MDNDKIVFTDKNVLSSEEQRHSSGSQHGEHHSSHSSGRRSPYSGEHREGQSSGHHSSRSGEHRSGHSYSQHGEHAHGSRMPAETASREAYRGAESDKRQAAERHTARRDTKSNTRGSASLGGTEYYRPFADRLRFLLMPFMCVLFYGLPTFGGQLLQNICGFVPIAFFMISGFLVLRDSEDRSKRLIRTIIKTAIAFAAFAVVLTAVNWLYYSSAELSISETLTNKTAWFNFLVMNVWQLELGGGIWYIQALLYAYVIIFFLDKLNLLRFDWIIAAVFIALSMLSGEFAGLIGFNINGYTYIPGNFLTRALPYLLLGHFIHRMTLKLCSIRTKWYWLGIVGGAVLCIGELLALNIIDRNGYYGHLAGMPVIAFCAVVLAVKNDHDFTWLERKLIPTGFRRDLIYYFCDFVWIGILAVTLFYKDSEAVGIIMAVIAPLTFLILYGVALLLTFIRRGIKNRKVNAKIKENIKKDKNEHRS